MNETHTAHTNGATAVEVHTGARFVTVGTVVTTDHGEWSSWESADLMILGGKVKLVAMNSENIVSRYGTVRI